MRKARWATGLCLVILALAVGAAAQTPEPMIHEPVAPPGGRIVSGTPGPRVVGSGAIGNPTAIRQQNKLLVEPQKTTAPDPTEPVFGTSSFGADRETSKSLDRETGADNRLQYVENFNPSVVPFKRMSALDAVRSDFSLGIHDVQQLRDVPVGGNGSPDRDLFWGTLTVELPTGGNDVAIPSVAPDMRILSYETQPATKLVFSKDSADNYYVGTDDPASSGQTIRLVFLADAPATYFGAPVPKGYRLTDATDSGLVRPVPSDVKHEVEGFIAFLGIRRDEPLDQVVDKLINYYRAFEAGPVGNTGSIYRDITFSQRGVCRHRSFSFVVTANVLGIPARYVSNEAHAFAEIWVPEREWLRVDLGGEALQLDVSNGAGKTIYRPRQADPFPKPPQYDDQYTTLNGDVTGLSQDQLDEARKPIDDPSGSGSGSGSGSTDPDVPDPSPAPGTDLRQAPKDAFPGQARTSTSVKTVDETAYRGESIKVSGRIEAGGAGAAGVRVDIWLAPSGEKGNHARFVGQTVTEADGSYTVTIDLPTDLDLGKHEVYASTPGDKKFGPSVSD